MQANAESRYARSSPFTPPMSAAFGSASKTNGNASTSTDTR